MYTDSDVPLFDKSKAVDNYQPDLDYEEDFNIFTGVSQEAGDRTPFIGEGEVSLEKLLSNQLAIANKIQSLITEQGDTFSSRDLKDLIQVSNTLIVNSHRTGETLKELTTYRMFFETVIEFIRQRQDSFGEELLEHLKKVAEEMKTEGALKQFT